MRNFLRFLVEEHPDIVEKTLLVGVTSVPADVGVVQPLQIHGASFAFLPIASYPRESDGKRGSMRLVYLRGLLRQVLSARLDMSRGTNFFHTPEPILLAPRKNATRNVFFSHGSVFNMRANFRFFGKTPLPWAYEVFAKWAIKKVDSVLVLDRDSESQYESLNRVVVRVSNSIVLPGSPVSRASSLESVRLIYAGRLSAGKRIDKIIEAAEACSRVDELRILGDGEEGIRLRSLGSKKSHFYGAVTPSEVSRHMRECDILVMNSTHEGMPMVILEALAAGMPVVTTPVGGVPEVVKFGSNAEESDGSSRSIVQAIETIARDYAEYAASALLAGRKFDYRTVNGSVFSQLFPSSLRGIK